MLGVYAGYSPDCALFLRACLCDLVTDVILSDLPLTLEPEAIWER